MKELPSTLHDLLEDCMKFPDKKWTVAEVKRIASPLLLLTPDKWEGMANLKRIELIKKRVPDNDVKDEEVVKFYKDLAQFEIMCRPSDDCVKFRNVTADELYPTIKKCMKRMTKNNVMELVDILKDVATIDYRQSNQEAFQAYRAFLPKLTQYVKEHPQIYKKLDPFYVVAGLNGVAVPVWPAWPAGKPGVLPAGLNGHNYAWAFPTLEAATYWLGVIGNAFPAIHAWLFDTGIANAIYY